MGIVKVTKLTAIEKWATYLFVDPRSKQQLPKGYHSPDVQWRNEGTDKEQIRVTAKSVIFGQPSYDSGWRLSPMAEKRRSRTCRSGVVVTNAVLAASVPARSVSGLYAMSKAR
jgi:hypothetical protein